MGSNRLLPVLVRTLGQREKVETLVEQAIQLQKKRYATKDEEEKSKLWNDLQEI